MRALGMGLCLAGCVGIPVLGFLAFVVPEWEKTACELGVTVSAPERALFALFDAAMQYGLAIFAILFAAIPGGALMAFLGGADGPRGAEPLDSGTPPA